MLKSLLYPRGTPDFVFHFLKVGRITRTRFKEEVTIDSVGAEMSRLLVPKLKKTLDPTFPIIITQ